jgi:hypothetical protein
MSKLNFVVEAELNSNWVHAHVATLAQAKALVDVFEAQDAIDVGIHLTNDATDQAVAEHKQYTLEQAAESLKWLNKQVAQGKMTLDNGIYTGNLANF